MRVSGVLRVSWPTRETRKALKAHEAGRVSFLDSITSWRGSWCLQRMLLPGVFDNEIRWFSGICVELDGD